MRITRPREWNYMSEAEQQAWAEKVGKEITEAEKQIREKMKEMEKNGDFDKKEPIKHLQESDNKMRWFHGGKL